MNNQILYFIAGEVPTNDEFEKASIFMGKGPFLEFISLLQLDTNGELMANVGVAGAVPDSYKNCNILDLPKVTKVTKVKAKEIE